MSPSEPTEEVSTAADVSGLIGSEHRLPRLPRDDLPAALTQATAAPDPLDNDKTAAARDQRISARLCSATRSILPARGSRTFSNGFGSR